MLAYLLMPRFDIHMNDFVSGTMTGMIIAGSIYTVLMLGKKTKKSAA